MQVYSMTNSVWVHKSLHSVTAGHLEVANNAYLAIKLVKSSPTRVSQNPLFLGVACSHDRDVNGKL